MPHSCKTTRNRSFATWRRNSRRPSYLTATGKLLLLGLCLALLLLAWLGSKTVVQIAPGSGQATAGAVGGGADFGISAGINAITASKAHDRTKNFATRHWLYEQIALKEAGINPGYIFAGGAGGQSGSARSAMQAHAAKGPGLAQSASAGADLALKNAMTAKTAADQDKVEAETVIIEAEGPTAEAKEEFFQRFWSGARDALRQGKEQIESYKEHGSAPWFEEETPKQRDQREQQQHRQRKGKQRHGFKP